MKKDIDDLMEAAGLDGVFVLGSARHNPYMTYFTGGVHVSNAYLLKMRGEKPFLYSGSMEREEAARSGLECHDFNETDPLKLLKQADGDVTRARALQWETILRRHNIRGRIGLYGQLDIGPAFTALKRLDEAMTEVELIGETETDAVLLKARATKDIEEIDHIRKIGRITTEVVGEIAEYLTGCNVRNEELFDNDGLPVTIGAVRRRINLALATKGAENPEGTIFAQGRDAGIPHSTGQDDQTVRLGKTIVFDIYPCEAGGGYFYDFTRTWSLGYATDEAQQLFEDVRSVYDEVMGSLRPDMPCRDLQILTCELFEAKGHPSILNTPKTQEGYVHSLAHGLGLAVHEGPHFQYAESNTDLLLTGSVVTIEPGLYYPERGMGVRIENPVWVRPDGKMETVVDYPLDFVLPMRS
ncbi:MAG: aminopeptidase P family protein [Anaerolineales bacterium]|nr:aminopeptidase P family protein [Anaerolineales bacterium]